MIWSLQYYRGGVKKVMTNLETFAKAESHFTNVNFYVDDEKYEEAMLVEIQSTWNALPKAPIRVGEDHFLPKSSKWVPKVAI